MTSDGFVAQVRIDWGEDSGGPITDVQILSWGNRAQRILASRGVLLTCWSTTTVAGQETYNLPTDYYKIDSIFDDDQAPAPKLFPMGVGDRTGEPGTPRRYWLWQENLSLSSIRTFGLHPVPDTNGTLKNLHVFGLQMPQTMALSSPGPAVNPEVDPIWQDAMADYALMCIYRRLGPDYGGDFRAQTELWQNWLRQADQYSLVNDYVHHRMDTAGNTVEYGD